MTFIFKKYKLIPRPRISEPLDNPNTLLEADLSDFDYTGFNLIPLEEEYYLRNDIELVSDDDTYSIPNFNNHYPLKQPWLTLESAHPNVFVNQSFILTRYGFAGRARYEMEKYKRWKPELVRLLFLEPKWAATIRLDWLDERGCFELLNLYKEYTDLEFMQYELNFIEQLFNEYPEWEQNLRILADKHEEWESLTFAEQNIYKKEYFGLGHV